VSVHLSVRVDEPGHATYAEQAWRLKEQIRREEDVLKQRQQFFFSAYRRSRSHLLVDDDRLAGFACVRHDGYILFLAVAKWARGEGYGTELVRRAMRDHDRVSVHVRVSNEGAIAFYEALGFYRVRRITSYYEDGGDALYLRLGERPSLRDRMGEILR
jgi:Acetyltransferases